MDNLITMREQAMAVAMASFSGGFAVKVTEHKGCRNNAPAYPAYSVLVRESGAKRGRAFCTIICPDFKLPEKLIA